MGFTGFYWVLLGFTGFHRVLLGFTEIFSIVKGFTGIGLAVTRFIGPVNGNGCHSGGFDAQWLRRTRTSVVEKKTAND